MTKVRVYAGACGFTALIKVKALDKNKISINLIAACGMLQSFNKELSAVDCNRGLFHPSCDSILYKTARSKIKHTDCPVPMAIIAPVFISVFLTFKTGDKCCTIICSRAFADTLNFRRVNQ